MDFRNKLTINHKKIFGRDITNIQRKLRNQSVSLYQKPTIYPLRPKPILLKKQLKKTKTVTDNYEQDILNYMKQLHTMEKDEKLQEINQNMRIILIQWLIEIHSCFKLQQQTLHLGLSYLNKYTSQLVVKRSDYQLVGVTCLWMASKYEEIYPPTIQNFAQATDNAYEIQDIKKMESKIISILQFNFNHTTTFQILQLHFLILLRTSKIPLITNKVLHYSMYILQLSLLQNLLKKYESINIIYNVLQLSCIICKVKSDGFMPIVVDDKQKKNCFKDLSYIVYKVNKFEKYKIVQRKYMSEKFSAVAKLRIDIK